VISKWSLIAVMAIATAACSESAPPAESSEAIPVLPGQTVAADSTMPDSPRITAPASGQLFTTTQRFSEHPRFTDVAGVRRVFVFVPDSKMPVDARRASTLAKADGMRAFEFSRSDGAPEEFCFQELSIGAVTLRLIEPGRIDLVSDLKTSGEKNPLGVRCDSSYFSSSHRFQLRGGGP